jgi:hypothetical protein
LRGDELTEKGMDALCKLGENKMPTILRKRTAGKRFEYITKEELDSMLAAGTARKLGGMPSYEELDTPAPVQKAKPPENLDAVWDEEDAPSQVYETRELKAAEPRRRTYRKTGTPKTDA